jgi:hypothetical protein
MPTWNAEAKDRLEARLCEMVCTGETDAENAQIARIGSRPTKESLVPGLHTRPKQATNLRPPVIGTGGGPTLPFQSEQRLDQHQVHLLASYQRAKV